MNSGSSPHGRGTQRGRTGSMGLSRFIPACAGNAWTGLLHGQDVPVHPRMRGERSSRSGPGVASHGSSLHARGTPLDGQPRFALTRFIPACAGNAVLRLSLQPWIPVHPRMRGERLSVAVRLNSSSGSSPHARGTRSRVPLAPFPVSVHPRMRGERISIPGGIVGGSGSSPHARGTPEHGQHACQDERFIPACAGNACNTRFSFGGASVHPRMRGERVDPLHDHDDG